MQSHIYLFLLDISELLCGLLVWMSDEDPLCIGLLNIDLDLDIALHMDNRLATVF